ncbi:MAG: GNAT family N-acetyltransferase [Ginsengibacter sp.]
MTNHLLDNPAWNAMNSGNRHLALGNDRTKFFPADVGPFAGLKNYDEPSFRELYDLIPPGRIVAIPSKNKLAVPKYWQIKNTFDIIQMIFNKASVPASYPDIIPLDTQHVPQMIELTKLTQPGPFLQRTIEFGNYTGILNSDRLIAMAGQRMHADKYVEISAVCTHPDFAGKGYASSLILDQVDKIVQEGNIPFLHVKADNKSAINLYKHLGFTVRSGIYIYALQKGDKRKTI